MRAGPNEPENDRFSSDVWLSFLVLRLGIQENFDWDLLIENK